MSALKNKTDQYHIMLQDGNLNMNVRLVSVFAYREWFFGLPLHAIRLLPVDFSAFAYRLLAKCEPFVDISVRSINYTCLSGLWGRALAKVGI